MFVVTLLRHTTLERGNQMFLPAGVWEPAQLVEVRQSLTSIAGAFPIPDSLAM
jgi:hypothetical protein